MARTTEAGTGATATSGTGSTTSTPDVVTVAGGNGEPAPAGVVLPVDTTSAQEDVAPEDASRPAMKDLKGVRYQGAADVKIFTKADLEKLGAVSPQSDLTWSRDNDFLVSHTDVNASTVDALIKLPGFTAV